ncbi:hypothetical protein VPNG_08835 [Cytospora leucostoma]|uniref:Transcription factor domain-containing protein n=1 Tax=Cytospora leucostoma TaxID=1230097 RepID=A0A423W1Z1_9PEZI|nr:hypothetical protein VPNG_08835 [Cytospora leucostoma]
MGINSSNRRNSDIHIVQVSAWDVQMHHYLTASAPHIQCAASQSLATFGHDPAELGNCLLRVTLTTNTPSAAAVLSSLLALSSLHRYGIHSHALDLKIKSIKALRAASKNGNIGTKEVIQHAAAGMLLCSFEVHQPSATSNQWAWYVAGVKQIISTAHLGSAQGDPDLDAILDWVFYHGIVGRVTWGHWREGTLTPPTCTQYMSPDPYYLKDERTSHAAAPSSLTLLGLLCEFCEIASPSPRETMSTRELCEYTAYLKELDWKLTRIEPPGEGADTNTILELYRLAILVYVNRMSDDLLEQAGKIQKYVDKAFSLFAQLGSCERQFPVFILGCEARTDEDRTVVLDLIARTEKQHSSRSFDQVKILMKAVWAQDDLADRELNYWGKLSSIIGSCSVVPSLV